MRVLFVTPEAFPYAKTGGLADVCGTLPPVLKQMGVDIRLIMPFYRSVAKACQPLSLGAAVTVTVGSHKVPCNFYKISTDHKIPVYFVDHPPYFDRPRLYGNAFGDYPDNLERFAFFAQATLKLIEKIGFNPDIIHCNDWQTGLIPALLHEYRVHFDRARTMFTIHNMGYQGLFPADQLPLTGLPFDLYYHPEGMEYWGQINLLKTGIVYADRLTTVSPAYANQIQTVRYGHGMEGIVYRRRNRLNGILNGIDQNLWNPQTDPFIASNYSPNQLSGKERCKAALIAEMKLDQTELSRPVMAIISRLDRQKGLDLVINAFPAMMAMGVNVVILGTGDKVLECALAELARKHPQRLCFKNRFNEAVAHRILAGSDLLLMPSRYEPCGLTHLYALKYGTVPVVRYTGGLSDTVHEFNQDSSSGNGFGFERFDESEFMDAVEKALAYFRHKQYWRMLQRNGMDADFSWHKSAKKYLQIYKEMTR